jgi:hypothetical protein
VKGYWKHLLAFFALLIVLIMIDGGVLSLFSDTEVTTDNGIKAYSDLKWLQTDETDFSTDTTGFYVSTHTPPGQVELTYNTTLAPVKLGLAERFAILATAGITNIGATSITGDVGTYPTSETGFDSVSLNGTNHAGNATTQGAQNDLTTAYNDAAGRTPVSTVGTQLGGTIETPGVYGSDAEPFQITGNLTLDAGGDPNAVFIFKMASTLTTAVNSQVILSNGTRAANVYWVVGSSATLGVNSKFSGTILAAVSITLNSGAALDGRALARNGAVTLDTNTITRPSLGYSISGWMNSSVFDTGILGAKFDMVFWDSYQPTGTSAVLKVRASNNLILVNGTAWTTLGSTSPGSIESLTGQYIQWRVEFSTTDLSKIPYLSEVRLYYRAYV